MHGAVHGGDGREVDDLHVTLEVRVLHDLASAGGVAADDAAAAQVQHVAPVFLHPNTRAVRGNCVLVAAERSNAEICKFVLQDG